MAGFLLPVYAAAGAEPEILFHHGVIGEIAAHGDFVLLDQLRIQENLLQGALPGQGFPYPGVCFPNGFVGKDHLRDGGGVGAGLGFRQENGSFLTELPVSRSAEIQVIEQHRLPDGAQRRIEQVQTHLHGMDDFVAKAAHFQLGQHPAGQIVLEKRSTRENHGRTRQV